MDSNKQGLKRAETPEAREQQLINAAVNLAEKKILDGTASSQIICHYLKLATSKSQEEVELLKANKELARAKVDSIKSAQSSEALYKEALDAMKKYSGQ